MSHTVTIRTELRDRECIAATVTKRLHGEVLAGNRHHLYDGEREGLGLQLPGWRYPVVVEAESGSLQFDDYGGEWGDIADIDRLVQGYTLELAAKHAREYGYSVNEEELEDGLVRLTMTEY